MAADKERFFDEIVHGTQYFRAPTPLENEWEPDIAKMQDYNIDAIQLRLNWRWYERKENEYDFSKIDTLFDIAEKHGKKVIVKFMLECAPQYIYEKYGGTRIGPRGEQIRGGSHGAFYGGWKPCFTNPDVKRRASLFVEKVAERYAGRKSLILWNAWNEIRSKPFAECFCPHCRRAFGMYLKEKFGTIEKMNDFYGTAEESFETIPLPSTPHGYWDTFEFKKFKGSYELYNYVDFVVKAVKKYDRVHPVMAHVGCTSAFQGTIEDVSDDFTVSKAPDFWGTSIPCDCFMQTNNQRLDFMMLNDFVRSVDKNYFLHELYPGLGMFKWYDTPFDLEFKEYMALASGVRGIVYWQYRAERTGYENDCSGIVHMDGSPKDVTYSVQHFGADLKKDGKYFGGASSPKSDTAIVFDFNSMLLSEIEDVCGPDFEFNPWNPLYYYKRSHTGMYRLMRNTNRSVDYASVTRPEEFKNYRVLYFPHYTMLDRKIVPYLQEFIENGGTVIADESFGMRQMNTWMQPEDIDVKPIMTARMDRRQQVFNGETIDVFGERVPVTPYRTTYNVKDAETVLKFDSGEPALQLVKYGKGKIYLSGFPIGAGYLDSESKALEKLVGDILDGAGVEKYRYSDTAHGIYEKRLTGDGYEILFIFNNSERDAEFEIPEKVVSVGGHGKMSGSNLFVGAKSMAYAVTEKS